MSDVQVSTMAPKTNPEFCELPGQSAETKNPARGQPVVGKRVVAMFVSVERSVMQMIMALVVVLFVKYG